MMRVYFHQNSHQLMVKFLKWLRNHP